jgi:hypothetical protein
LCSAALVCHVTRRGERVSACKLKFLEKSVNFTHIHTKYSDLIAESSLHIKATRIFWVWASKKSYAKEYFQALHATKRHNVQALQHVYQTP